MNATTYFFNLKGDDLSFEIRRGTKSLCGRVCLKNGSFIFDSCSFNLAEVSKYIDTLLATIDSILENRGDYEKSR